MNKKLFSITLCLILLWSMVLPAAADTAETEETIQIVETVTLTVSTVEEFLDFAENCRLDSYSRNLIVSLESDIDLSGTDFDSIPIFSGSFHGNSHTISGLAITGEGSQLGLFRYLTADSLVRDLQVSGTVHPNGSRSSIGGIAGENAGNILRCSFTGSVSGSDYVGGIAGKNAVTGIISGCSVSGDVHADHFVGGIVGENAGVIRECTNQARINTTPQQNNIEISDITMDTLTNSEAVNTVTDIGGITGENTGVIRSCTNEADVGYKHMGYNIGGIAGSQNGYICDCVNRGSIQGRKEVGGIAGQMEPDILMVYTEDTLQILKGQLETMSGLVNRAYSNAYNSANQVTTQIALMKDQVQTALDAINGIVPDINSPEIPDMDSVIAAQNALTAALLSMTKSLDVITSATQSTLNNLGRDLNAISAQISAMSATINEASENLGAEVIDISDQDTDDLFTGKVERCTNYGDVLADLNVGGISGAIAMENDLDILEDWQQTGESSLNFQNEVRAVIVGCINHATVTGKKQNAGGITGWQSLGLIRNCINTGSIDGSGADYVGGIAGLSSGYIRSSYAKCQLKGKTYVGGIAGSGTIVTDTVSLVQIPEGHERLGAILGSLEDNHTEEAAPIHGNFYLTAGKDMGAIDGISYAGLAEKTELETFLTLDSLPDIFKTVTIRFIPETGEEIILTLNPGENLDTAMIPALAVKDGYTCIWEGLSEDLLQDVRFDMTFRALYTPCVTVIASTETRENGLPILLLEGAFGDGDQIVISHSEEAPDPAKDYELLEVWTLNLPETADTARFLLPADAADGYLALRVLEQDGSWAAVPFVQDGSYLVFSLQGSSVTFALLRATSHNGLYLTAGIGAMAVVALTVIFTVRKRKKNIPAETV